MFFRKKNNEKEFIKSGSYLTMQVDIEHGTWRNSFLSPIMRLDEILDIKIVDDTVSEVVTTSDIGVESKTKVKTSLFLPKGDSKRDTKGNTTKTTKENKKESCRLIITTSSIKNPIIEIKLDKLTYAEGMSQLLHNAIEQYSNKDGD